ncbi:MAG: hypothetical protein U0470_02495 [Anaerolineae bacterium]
MAADHPDRAQPPARRARRRATDTVVDLPGLTAPSSPATDGRDLRFTAVGDDGAHLLAYRGGISPTLRLDWKIAAGAVASPVLGRTDAATGLIEVLLMGTDGNLVALDASVDAGTAKVRWSTFIGNQPPAFQRWAASGRVYVAAGQVAQALSRADGDVVSWSVPLDSAARHGSVNLAPGGLLYVATVGRHRRDRHGRSRPGPAGGLASVSARRPQHEEPTRRRAMACHRTYMLSSSTHDRSSSPSPSPPSPSPPRPEHARPSPSRRPADGSPRPRAGPSARRPC